MMRVILLLFVLQSDLCFASEEANLVRAEADGSVTTAAISVDANGKTEVESVSTSHGDSLAEEAGLAALADTTLKEILEANPNIKKELIPAKPEDAATNVKKMKHLFNKVDLDGDKKLTPTEMRHLFTSLERQIGLNKFDDKNDNIDMYQQRIANDFMAGMDTNHDGKVTFKEYAVFNAQMTTDPEFVKKNEERHEKAMMDMLVDQIPGLREKMMETERAFNLKQEKKL